MADRSATPVLLLGGRDLRATLDRADSVDDPRAAVVACPPHPQHGGDRHDSRLRAVSDALGGRSIDCLRIDYGAFDGGRGERDDALTALAWAADRYETVSLFGYSFGGAVAVLAAAEEPDRLGAVSALAPARRVSAGLDVPEAVSALTVPLQVVYGTRDDTADAAPVADRARERGGPVETLAADHFFVGQRERVAELVAEFLTDSG